MRYLLINIIIDSIHNAIDNNGIKKKPNFFLVIYPIIF